MLEIKSALDAAKNFPAVPMLIWTDPPFGTGKTQEQAGLRYRDERDTDYVIESLQAWLPLMDSSGTVCVCCDYRLVGALINGLDWVYRGEIVWEFGLGRPRMSWWPVRHNNILTFTRTRESGLFNSDAIPRTKRLAPKSGYSADKPAGSVWDFTMSNTSTQRVGYPNQKPLEIIEPFVLAHTNLGDLVVDPFMGSGSTGVAAQRHGRTFYGCDVSADAYDAAYRRLGVAL